MNHPRKEDREGKFPRYRRMQRKVCVFCANKTEKFDYKDVNMLRKYLSDRGKLIPRRGTGNCARHQRKLTEAIKRARFLALLPYVG